MSSSPRLVRTLRRSSLAVVGLLLTTTIIAAGPAPAAEAAPSCSAFTSKVYDQLNPRTAAQGLSATAAGYADFQAQGFTTNRPYTMTASPKAGSSLAAVHWLYRASNRSYFYSYDTAEIKRAIRFHGYRDLGVAFYAATTGASCLRPVWSYYRPGGYHRFVTSASEGESLVAAGWRKVMVRFYLGTPATASVFTIAVIPDTQQEVLRSNDSRFAHRVRWLVDNESGLDLRFVSHTGDVVNWDTSDHIQYVRARAALSGLNGRIPYSVTIGNHDTAAVGPGGGAADPPNTRRLVRDTRSSNTYLNQGTALMAGQFEPRKIDNAYHTFSAGGRQWLMLNLELWPRRTAIAWAQRVVASHPQHNVMVYTHSYMTRGGAIYGSAEYGETSPQYLFDNLIKQYPNIKVVFGGHSGLATQRQDVGVRGNRINSFVQAMHDTRTNPVRVVEINLKADTIGSFMYSPYTRTTYPAFVVRHRTAGWMR